MFSGGLGGSMSKSAMKTTSQIKTTPSIGKTSIAKPTTGASSTTQTAEFKPPTSTKSVKFEPVKASIISNGTQKEMKIQNIAMSSQFNNLYTPEELRFFDYITDKKITAPQTQGAEPILKSMTPKIPETKPQGSSTQPISLKGSQTAADKDKKNIKKDNIQFPDPKAAEILTAAEFFKAKKIEKRLQAAEQEAVFLGKHSKDYSLYFTKKSASLSSEENGFMTIKPVKFTADMLHTLSAVRMPDLDFKGDYCLQTITTNPPLSEIPHFKAQHFEIKRDGVAEIKFLQPVDLSNFDIDTDIVLEPCFVNFYPQCHTKKQKKDKAKGMDVLALITMYGVWPAPNPQEIRKRILNSESPEAFHFNQVLQLFCHSKKSRFRSYDSLRGVFSFEVDGICDGPYDIPTGN